MVGVFTQTLDDSVDLTERKMASKEKLKNLKTKLHAELSHLNTGQSYCCFCAGSLAREDCGKESDLDVFLLSESDLCQLDKYQILAKIIQANDELGFPRLSNDGQYLSLFSYAQMEKALGHPSDDYSNLFTTRMLLMLESAPVYNEVCYNSVLDKVINLYFRDKKDDHNFIPMFILNDILRYWRTMCLNYETIRVDTRKPWRKKNVNLKFSRMLSVYSAVIPAVLGLANEKKQWIDLCKMTPLRRISFSLDHLDDKNILPSFVSFLTCYSEFLKWKEMAKTDVESFISSTENKAMIKNTAENFSDFIFDVVNHSAVDKKMRKFITI